MAFAAYFIFCALVDFSFVLGLTPVPLPVLAVSQAGIFLCNVLIYVIFRTGLNKQFRDPSLTFLQMIVASFWTMEVLYYADTTRGAALLVYLAIFIFGLFKLNVRQFLFLSFFTIAGYATVILLLYKNHPETINMKIEILDLVVLATVLPGFSLVGGYINRVKARVSSAFNQSKEAELKFRTIFDAASDGIILMNLSEKIISDANKKMCDMLGYTKEEILSLGILDIYPPETIAFVLEQSEKLFRREIPVAMDIPVLRKDQTVFFADISASPIILEKKEYAIGIFRDITDRRQMEDKLRFEEQRFRAMVEHSSDIIVLVNREGTISYINPAVEQVLGFTPEERIGATGFDLFHPEDVKFIAKSFMTLISDPNAAPITGVVRLRHKDGHYRFIEGVGSNLVRNNIAEGVILNYRDVTERKKAEEILIKSEQRYMELSIIDDLTQLYNSRHFYAQLAKEIERSNRYEQPFTLLLMDLDKFKEFNDTYGHVEGDLVLKRLGQTIVSVLRETDSAYRYGGEEFTMILPMTTDEEGVVIARRIQAALRKEAFSPVVSQKIYMTVSIGLAQYKLREEMKAFVHRVDQLMYQAKQQGRDTICTASKCDEQS